MFGNGNKKAHPLKAAIKGDGNVYRIFSTGDGTQTVKAEKWHGGKNQLLDLACGLVFDNQFDANEAVKKLNEIGMLIEKHILHDEFEGFEHTLEEVGDDVCDCEDDDTPGTPVEARSVEDMLSSLGILLG